VIRKNNVGNFPIWKTRIREIEIFQFRGKNFQMRTSDASGRLLAAFFLEISNAREETSAILISHCNFLV